MSETLRDKTLATQPPAVREQLLTAAASAGVADPNDPGWFIVGAVLTTQVAAQAVGEAASAIQAAVQAIPATVSDGATKAAVDVKSAMESAIAGTIKSSLDTAVQSGAATLRKAAADLPKVGRENQNAIVDEWRAALANEARRQTWAGFFQKLSVGIALAALLVGALFVGGMAAGAWGMTRLLAADHQITPSGWQLEVGANGKPLCGSLAGRSVCLAQRSKP